MQLTHLLEQRLELRIFDRHDQEGTTSREELLAPAHKYRISGGDLPTRARAGPDPCHGRPLAALRGRRSRARRAAGCFVPTASGDEEWQIVRFYESFARRAEASHVSFNPWPRAELREHVLAQDAVYVSGGNTANALAIWRVHGFDQVLREAWERGILLCGWSAGMICWFEASVTDSFGPQLEGMRDGLGFLPGARARTTTARNVVARCTARSSTRVSRGYAADDGAALHFVGTELHEVVLATDGALAYRVEPGSETPLAARLL